MKDTCKPGAFSVSLLLFFHCLVDLAILFWLVNLSECVLVCQDLGIYL